MALFMPACLLGIASRVTPANRRIVCPMLAVTVDVEGHARATHVVRSLGRWLNEKPSKPLKNRSSDPVWRAASQ